jgi:signal transduction histidine kinase
VEAAAAGASAGRTNLAGEPVAPHDRADAAEAATVSTDLGDALGAVVRDLGGVHHDLAALMRAAPTPAPRRLEHGFTSALRAALDGELRGAFDALEVDLPSDTVTAADALPDTVADLLLGATLEAARNASRHARGGDLHRALRLRLDASSGPGWVTIKVSDNGIGLRSSARGDDTPRDAPPASASTRSGLLTHGALLALVGGSLAVHSVPMGGTTVTLRVPRVSAVDDV